MMTSLRILAARTCAVFFAVGIGFSPCQAAEVNGVRVWAGPDHTRVVLDLSSTVEYKLFTLGQPERVVLDIQSSDFLASIPDLVEKGLLGGIRNGRRDDGALRMVLDLDAKARPKSFLLPPAEEYGHRLVVDLYPEDGNQPKAKTIVDSLAETMGKERDVIIAVDAGHGGEDPGAIGAKGTREKDVTLAIARKLAEVIDAEPGMRAVLVRDGDYYVAHRDRFEKARKNRADLFVSVHADAFFERKVRGSSVYVLSPRGASSEAARRLAARENRSDLVGGVKLADKDDVLASVLLDLSQSATQEASTRVATRVLGALKEVGKTHKKNVERANFLVLKSPDVPSILIETAFISNPSEEARLKDPTHQKRLAAAIVSGIKDHFRTTPPPGTYFAAHALPDSHVVVSGETLSGIAQRYAISVTDLRQENDLGGKMLQVGAVLRIPTG